MTGATAVYILDSKGKVIISRNYKGEIPVSISEKFIRFVIDQNDNLIKPLFTVNGVTFCWIKYKNIYLVVTTMRNSNATLLMSFLYKFVEILKGYLKKLEEESIKDNSVIIYELLDEIMDNGFPQITETKVIREYIKNEAHELSVETTKSPIAMTNAISWRADNIKHKKNEIFLDVIEKLNILVSSNGTVLRSEILGSLKMKSFLSGMPELKLGLNDKLLLDSVAKNRKSLSSTLSQSDGDNFMSTGHMKSGVSSIELEDIKFHQCVRLSRFENDRTISFIPPDGEFELMSYRITAHAKPIIWVNASINTGNSISHINYLVKLKTQFRSKSFATNVEIEIPVPPNADSPSFKIPIGTVNYLPDKDVMIWSIKHLGGLKDYVMNAHFGLPTIKETVLPLTAAINFSNLTNQSPVFLSSNKSNNIKPMKEEIKHLQNQSDDHVEKIYLDTDDKKKNYLLKKNSSDINESNSHMANTIYASSLFASKRPIYIRFELPYFTVSGIAVRYLKIIEKSGYHALPWVRYITQNGDYQLRMF